MRRGRPAGREHFVPGIPVGARSPDWTHVAVHRRRRAARPGSRSRRSTAARSSCWRRIDGQPHFAWSPDSKRLAFVDARRRARRSIGVPTAPGSLRSRRSSRRDPAWSPNGQLHRLREAGVARTHIHVVKPDGSGNTRRHGRARRSTSSRSGRPTARGLVLRAQHRRGAVSAARRLQLGRPALLNNAGSPTAGAPLRRRADAAVRTCRRTEHRRALRRAALQVARANRPEDRQAATLSFGDGALFSNDGTLIAFSSGGECRDRDGIYAMQRGRDDSAGGSRTAAGSAARPGRTCCTGDSRRRPRRAGRERPARRRRHGLLRPGHR